MAAFATVCLWLVLSIVSSGHGLGLGRIEKTFVSSAVISKLAKLIREDYIKNTLPSADVPAALKPLPGLYSMHSKSNFNGALNSAFWRRMTQVENNIFTTLYINTVLLEAFERGEAPAPSSLQLSKALEILPDFLDKNRPYNNSIVFFYPLAYDEDGEFWYSQPNILLGNRDFFNNTAGIPLPQVMEAMGFTDFAEYLQFFASNPQDVESIAGIPGDIDTVFVNLGLGSALFRQQDKLPGEWNQWRDTNTNLTSVFDALKQYSYQPFSDDADKSSIDPKTYFAFRHFLDKAKEEGKDVALVGTWTQSLEEQRAQFEQGVSMPRNINDVCVGVTANVVHGVASSILSGLVNASVLDDPLVAKIYHNSTELLTYVMKTNMTGRPDLASRYYPSLYQVEWFISRTLVKLEDATRQGPLPHQLLEFVRDELKKTFREEVTNRLLMVAQEEAEDCVFYEDFLGTADLFDNGTMMKTGEDRIYSTALAINVLINSWTYLEPTTQQLHWDKGTPASVKSTTAHAVNWLAMNALDHYMPGGVAYGSYFWGLNWEFPANRYEHYNGTAIDDWEFPPNYATSVSMRGYVPADDYAAMLEREWFGNTPKLDFHGYNAKLSPEGFTYFESAEWTYSITLLALSQYKAIRD